MGLVKRWLRSRHERRQHRLESCTECLLQQRRERQYLERLRGAEIPRASDDLTARLLARTEELASEQPATPPGTPGPAPRRGLLYPALVAGGVAAAATLMAGSAYVLGGDAAPLEAGAASSAFLKQDLPAGDEASRAPGGAESGWRLTGGPGLTPAGAITAAQLNGLRSQGWTCPELRELGYHLVWAKGGVAAGADILELRLTDGQHFATVLEQHGLHEQQSARVQPPGGAGVQQAPAATPPVNVLTGHPAAADGFSPVGLEDVGLPAADPGASPGEATLWINVAAPYRAIYETPSGTFTYVSDQPAEQADDGVAALVRAGTASPAGRQAGGPGGGGPGGEAGDASADAVTARLERGLGRILELLAP